MFRCPVDGIHLVWQGTGIDRSLDALKHTNSAGTSPGGVIALAGDDHGCQSSTLASEQAGVCRGVPVVASLFKTISTSASSVLRCRATPAAGSTEAISETV